MTTPDSRLPWRTETIQIEFADCVKWTRNQLDAPPHSAYKLKTISAVIQAHPLWGGEIDWSVLSGDRVIGEGETADEAIADAKYNLMASSRRIVRSYAESSKTGVAEIIINPAWIEAGKGSHIDIP